MASRRACERVACVFWFICSILKIHFSAHCSLSAPIPYTMLGSMQRCPQPPRDCIPLAPRLLTALVGRLWPEREVWVSDPFPLCSLLVGWRAGACRGWKPLPGAMEPRPKPVALSTVLSPTSPWCHHSLLSPLQAVGTRLPLPIAVPSCCHQKNHPAELSLHLQRACLG